MIETIRSISNYINDGDWIESKDQSTCGIRLVQTGNIGNTRYLEKASRSKYISEETFERLQCSEIFAGDILISRLPDPVGRACIVPKNLGKAITAVDCTIVRVNKEKCLPEYLLYYTDSSIYRHQVNKYLLGATRIRISRKNLETIQVPLPDIANQKDIVRNLLKVDALIDKIYEQLELMDQLVKSRFIELFGDPVSNPKRWNKEELSQCLISIDNGKSFVCEAGSRVENEPAVLKLSAATYGYYKPEENKAMIDADQFVENAEVHSGDLLFTRKNTPELVGMCAYVYDTPTKLMMPDLIFRLNASERCNKIFLWKLINHDLFRPCIENIATGSAKSMSNISKERLLGLKIILPPLELQQQFAAFVAEVDKSKFVVQQSLRELETLKKSLMQQYFG